MKQQPQKNIQVSTLLIPHAQLLFGFTDKYWSDANNRRNFFIEFALQKKFDPMVTGNWKNVQYKDMIKQVKGKRSRREKKK